MNNTQQMQSLEGAFKQAFTEPSFSQNHLFKLYLATVLSFVPGAVYLSFLLFSFYIYLSIAISFLPGLAGSASGLHIAAYITFLIFFTAFIIFLLRPIVPNQKNEEGVSIDKKLEPAIFFWADVLRSKLDVDSVEKVVVNPEVFVDVYYADVKDFYHHKLTVSIGVPFLQTLSVNEVTSILAHHMAHYRDKKARFCYFAIRFMREWMYHVVHNEDGWSARVVELQEKLPPLLAKIVFLPVSLGIVLVNRLFHVLLGVLEAVSERILFDSEYLADQVQAEVIGSKQFDHMLKHLVQIDQAYHAALERVFSKEIVPDNISEFIYSIYAKSSMKTDQFIEMSQSETFNSWHFLPSPSPRTRKVKELNVEPIFFIELSFSELFSDLSTIGKNITRVLYERHQLETDATQLESVVDERDRPIVLAKEEKLLSRFASGLYRREIVWEMPELDKFAQLEDDKIIPFLNKVIVSIRNTLPSYNKYIELLDEYNKQRAQYHFYQWLIKDGSKNRPDMEVIDNLKLYLRDFEKQFKSTPESYRKFYGVRAVAAISLGRDSKAYGSARKLATMLVRLGNIYDAVSDCKTKCSTLEKLLVRRAEGDALHHKTISRLTRMILKVVEDMELAMSPLPASLIGDEKLDIMVNRLHLEELNGEDYERLTADRYRELVRYYEAYNTAISAKLAQFVDMVEKKLGIESVVRVSLDQA